jgi:hypothetical protein
MPSTKKDDAKGEGCHAKNPQSVTGWRQVFNPGPPCYSLALFSGSEFHWKNRLKYLCKRL